MAADTGYLPRLGSREEFVDYLEGYIDPAVAELQDGKLTRKLLKTYMLETARHSDATPDLAALFPPQVRLHRLDDALFRVEDTTHQGQVIGLLEALEERQSIATFGSLSCSKQRAVN